MSKQEKLIIDYIELLKREYIGLTQKIVENWGINREDVFKFIERQSEIIKEVFELKNSLK